MDKKSIVMLLATSCFATSVFATNFINQFIATHNATHPSIAKTHKTTNKMQQSYTDFSGEWHSDCEGQHISMTIENDADSITIGGQDYRIGKGLQSESDSNDEDVRHEHRSLQWNESKSSLIVKDVSVYKDITEDRSSIEVGLGTISLTMKKGQLNFNGKFTMLKDDGAQMDPINVHCVFSKKQ